MRKQWHNYRFLVLALILIPSAPIPVFGQVTVFPLNAQDQFVTGTGAMPLLIPDSQTAFPGTLCGVGDIGPTGIGPQVDIAFDTNNVTITGATGNSLCIFDDGTLINPPGNTDPPLMIANTIVGNGEDDFLLVFQTPVSAVGFRFLTNLLATEQVTLKDELGQVISIEEISSLTPPNKRQFIGFQSTTRIKSVLIDTNDGNTQNEGFDQIFVQMEPLPTLADLLERVGTLETQVQNLQGGLSNHYHKLRLGKRFRLPTGPAIFPESP